MKFPDRRGLAKKYYPDSSMGAAYEDMSELPLFAHALVVVDNRRFNCPHCNSPVTFSQLGHAHRWGWCPFCWDGRSPLPAQLVADAHRGLPRSRFRNVIGDPVYKSSWRVASATLCYIYKKGLQCV